MPSTPDPVDVFPQDGKSFAPSFEPPHICEAFERVYDALYLLEPEVQCRVINAAAAMFGLTGQVYKPKNL